MTDIQNSTFAHRAIEVIEYGRLRGGHPFQIIPTQPEDKKPVPGLGASSRTNSHEVSYAWGRIWPNANVGLCADENYTLLETDDEADFTEKIRAITKRDIPTTLKMGSGRENRNCRIFKRIPECGNDCLEVPGVFEFRNRNQYVNAPGSIHPMGLGYRWIEDAPVAEFPAWLMKPLQELDGAYCGRRKSHHQKLGAFATLRNVYRLRGNPQDLLEIQDFGVYLNERHYTLLSLAGLLHDGERSADEIADILKDVRDAYFQEAAEKSDYEIENIANNVVHLAPHISRRVIFGGWAMTTPEMKEEILPDSLKGPDGLHLTQLGNAERMLKKYKERMVWTPAIRTQARATFTPGMGRGGRPTTKVALTNGRRTRYARWAS